MEPEIGKLFSPQILIKALKAYGIAAHNAHILDGFESFIYKVHKNGMDYILRISHESRRTANQVQGESEFLNHLMQGGLSVPQVLLSEHSRLVERIPADDGSFFLTTLFEKAPGHPPSGEDWGPDLFKTMGAFMGKMHRLSKVFNPSLPCYSRYDIEQDCEEMVHIGRKHLPTEDHSILKAYLDTVEEICQLPKDPDSYGLCHVDFHGGNFFVTAEGRITLFDFDDCQYAWFIYDVAMALFYAIDHDCSSPEALEEARRFLSAFWQGYQAENKLNQDWLAVLPLFLRLREIDLYILLHRSKDIGNLDPWCASYMKNRREKILERHPYCGLDYKAINN